MIYAFSARTVQRFPSAASQALCRCRCRCLLARTTSTLAASTTTILPAAPFTRRNKLPFSSFLCLSLAIHPSLTATTAALAFSTGAMPKQQHIPSLPLRYRDGELENDKNKLDLSVLSATINAASETRQAAYDTSRKLQSHIINIVDQIGTPEAAAALKRVQETYADSLIPRSRRRDGSDANANDNDDGSTTTTSTQNNNSHRTPREANLSHVAENLVRASAYQHFLTTGTLLPPQSVDWIVTDEEYLAGAVMGLCGDLQHYGLGRATVRDVASVQAACDLVAACLDYLLQLDFRNGPLRRKYDGCKYALKTLETLLYELAVTSPPSPTSNTGAGAASGEPLSHSSSNSSSNNRPKEDSESLFSLLLPVAELESLKQRMEHRDDLRETLIKKCRDGQKAAKQSIFALHRGDVVKAVALLQECAASIRTELLPMVQEEPPLRFGSFAGVVEEYVEAKLFCVWLHGREAGVASATELSDTCTAAAAAMQDGTGTGATTSSGGGGGSDNSTHKSGSSPSGILLLPEDFVNDIMPLEPDEYLGGLCDLTGEIGRYAVQRGTARDVAGVKQCLRANSDILTALQSMERLPSSGSGSNNNSIMKKLDVVRSSVQKIERMLYELSLSEAAGGRSVHSDVPMADANDDDGTH